MAAWTVSSHWRTRPVDRSEGAILMPALRPFLTGTFIFVVLGIVSVGGAHPPAAEPSPAVYVTGELLLLEQGPGSRGRLGENALQWRGLVVEGLMSMSDERLSGDSLTTWNADLFRPRPFAQASGGCVTGNHVVENARGSWKGDLRGVVWPRRGGFTHQVMLVGDGWYEGLRALLYFEMSTGDANVIIEGLIFPGEMPPMPKPYVAE
jgi:hypothetical protein